MLCGTVHVFMPKGGVKASGIKDPFRYMYTACVCIQMCLCVCIYIYMCVYVRVYKIYIYIYIIHMYICKNVFCHDDLVPNKADPCDSGHVPITTPT